MNLVYQNILASIEKNEKNLAVLIDPDKMMPDGISRFIQKVNNSITTYIFVGGSQVDETKTDILVSEIKKHTSLPIILFPGDVLQVTSKADAILFLSLISGRNPDYLIGKHVESIPSIKNTNLEVISTGYMLIENGRETSVQKVTGTQPMSRNNIQQVVDTALAGEFLGMKLMYLEAGSGATHPIDIEMILEVKKALKIPLIVGGGIRSKQQLDQVYNAGADLAVIGTAFEEDESFFDNLQK
jgi:phosphoglycerol geranylgeranyltransferase